MNMKSFLPTIGYGLFTTGFILRRFMIAVTEPSKSLSDGPFYFAITLFLLIALANTLINYFTLAYCYKMLKDSHEKKGAFLPVSVSTPLSPWARLIAPLTRRRHLNSRNNH